MPILGQTACASTGAPVLTTSEDRPPGSWDPPAAFPSSAVGTETAAEIHGEWQTDSSQHCAKLRPILKAATVTGTQPELGRTLRVAYFFSGTSRRASIAESLRSRCESAGVRLVIEEIDILVGGAAHNLLDTEAQDKFLQRIEEGDFDCVILSPPCGTWSRANFANDQGPQPCRNRKHPWGLPNLQPKQARRAAMGNEFVHFSIRALQAVRLRRRKVGKAPGHSQGRSAKDKRAGHGASAKVQRSTRARRTMALLEHPEDLGATHRGHPASIWQLEETRKALGDPGEFTTVAGHQCQFGVDYAKPTRLLSDLPGVEKFGHTGWPIFDSRDRYIGPLPHCGHKHGAKMIGQKSTGVFHTSPTAAYPPGMCDFIAGLIFDHWISQEEAPCGPGLRASPLALRPLRHANKTLLLRPAAAHRGAGEKGAYPEGGGQEVIVTPPTTSFASTTAAASSSSSSTSTGSAPRAAELVSADQILLASEEANSLGVDRPLREGPDLSVQPDSDSDDERGGTRLEEADRVTSDEEKEAGGIPRPKRGAGWWGHGPPLRPRRKGVHRDFVDGGGLASPGRWPPDRRRLPEGKVIGRLQDCLLEGLKSCEPLLQGGSCKAELLYLACNRRRASPFPSDAVLRTRRQLGVILQESGFQDGRPRPGDAAQAVQVRLLQELLRASDDPDVHYLDWWATGVWVGSSERCLPRTPALFDRKTRWKLDRPDSKEYGEWQVNYSSVGDHLTQVKKQFDEEVAEGLMEKTTLRDALRRFGDRVNLAAIGAIAKKGDSADVRVIFDGSNGIHLNHHIRVRDQVKCPTSADLKEVLGEMAEERSEHFSLGFDVSKAHRRVPVVPEEWGLLGCQLEGTAAATARQQVQAEDAAAESRKQSRGLQRAAVRPLMRSRAHFSEKELDEDVYLNLVGTFGVGSAGYWWQRSGAAILRVCHYLIPRSLALWLLLYADDGWATGRGERFDRALLLMLYILDVLNLPISWKKVQGGVQMEWVGYALDVGRFELGITASRARWAAQWLEDKVSEQRVRLGELRQGLGRLQFVANALEHLKPFLGPLFAWASAGPKYAKPHLPVMICVIMGFLAKELRGTQMSQCRVRSKDLGEVFRLDAKAEGEDVAIGGWRCQHNTPTSQAAWFAVRLNRRNAPWAFARGEPFRVVATLELLGVLLGVMTLMPLSEFEKSGETTGLVTIGCGTDNRGNSFLMDRLLTTRYPLGVVLCELAAQMNLRRATVRASWVPRLQNEEADALTNWDFRHFSEVNRVPVDLDALDFVVLRELLETGEAYHLQVEQARAAEKAMRLSGAARPAAARKRAGESLREREPW